MKFSYHIIGENFPFSSVIILDFLTFLLNLGIETKTDNYYNAAAKLKIAVFNCIISKNSKKINTDKGEKYTMQNIDFPRVEITGGFWREKQEINRKATLKAVYERFKETHRFDALKCRWKEGEPDMPHIFWDSDVAKWIEGASYILAQKRDDEIEEIIENAIDCIIENSDENGYFNSHFLVTEQEKRFRDRGCHELYCAGHLFEAAAYYNATGRGRFLRAMCRYADYIEQVFEIEKSAAFTTPGHPEIELALMRLYKTTGQKRYAELAKFFIDEHGKKPWENEWANAFYNQDDVPIRERKTAQGHCVRALYLMCGAADVAKEYGDEELKNACRRFFESVVGRRMYITGGVGSTNIGEAFTVDYDLPNRTAYSETCASIAMAMFANRMLGFKADSRYADIVEKALYNGIISGVALDGRSFFYENPLEMDPDFNNINTSTKIKERFPITKRLEVFDCSCCPPNILRFVASAAGLIYGFDDETVYVHQYAESTAEADGIKIRQKTEYPKNGKITVTCSGRKRLALRIPGWCRSFRINCGYTLKDGYAYITLTENTEVQLELDMPVRLVSANRRVHADAGRVAVMRGPVVYCAEGADNGEDIKSAALNINAAFEAEESEFLLPILKTEAYMPAKNESLYYDACDDYEKIPFTLIPYFAFANRGESEMQVWLLRRG